VVVWEVNPMPDLSRPPSPVGDDLAASIERSYRLLACFCADRAGLSATG